MGKTQVEMFQATNCISVVLFWKFREPEITTQFGEGFGRVMMAQLSCSGIEQGLSECGFISGKQYNCGHGNDVGIICSM